jgi:hypothetical protein
MMTLSGKFWGAVAICPMIVNGTGSQHKTKGQIWLHRGPQHGVIGTARGLHKKEKK